MAVHTYSVPGLRGRRASLRAPCRDDAPRLFALFSDAATMRWWPRAPMQSLDEAAAHVEECAAFLAGGDRIDWVVTDAREEAAIGTCTLHGIDLRRRSAEIGYALLPESRGRGIATDAVTQVVAWGRRNLGLVRIEARVARDNVASRRLLERLGFAPSATDEDGVERWTLDATATDHSWRSAESRYALPSAYKARRLR